MSSSLIGKNLGSYKVVEQIGQGGMATVYLGYQATVDRHVAIKVLPPHPALDTQFVSRFETEAKTIARLQHPHILPLYDYGKQDDILYLVMAYAEGGSLEERISEGAMSLKRIDKYLHEIAGAMDYAHRQGIYHRDIKPANILLSSEGHALLADFGIAKLAEGDANLTGTGVVGTPMYMAPEQAEGMPMDARADVYSLGVVVYQMLTGKIPFHADSVMQIMLKVMQEPAPSILEARPDLPPALANVIEKVLTKEPDDRYQTAIEFANAFSEVVANSSDSRLNTPVQPMKPVEKVADASVTDILEPQTNETPQSTSPDPAQSQPQTVVIHQGGNQYILIGGFLLIAAMLMIVVLVLVSSQNEETQPVATQVVEQATQADAVPTEADVEPTAIPTVAAITVPTFGRVSFNSVEGNGDGLTLRVDELDPPGAGNAYYAYLLNTGDDSLLELGEVAVDPIGSGVLSYTDELGRMLPALYNVVAIAVAEEGESAEEGTIQGEVVYHGSIPIELTQALSSLFVASEEGVNGGGYVETMDIEAKNAANHAGLAASATSVGGMSSHAEHTINILRGEAEDLNGNGRGENPGRGVGVIPVIDLANAQLASAVNVEGATPNIQANADIISVCLNNTLLRANRLIELEATLLAAESLEAVETEMQEATNVATAIVEGFDFNENGEIETFEEECGLAQITSYGVLAGAMDIVEGGLEQ